jgi:hypothetical protein
MKRPAPPILLGILFPRNTASLFHNPQAFFSRRSGAAAIRTKKHYTLACLRLSYRF